MFNIQPKQRRMIFGALAIAGTILLPYTIHAQDRADPGRFQDGDRPPTEHMTRIEPGTVVDVRTNEYINSDHRDDRIYTGIVNADVYGQNGRVAFPKGSPVELIVRVAPDRDLILDLESVTAYGERYAIDADTQRIDSKSELGENKKTGEYVGGGAVLGAIIGAIAGGGKGAAIGAGAGAAVGAGAVLTHGKTVRVPAESLITFRLDRPLVVGIPDRGRDREGHHYHEYPDTNYSDQDRDPR